MRFTSAALLAPLLLPVLATAVPLVPCPGATAQGALADPAVYPLVSGSPDRALWLSGIGDFEFDPPAVFLEDASTGTASLTGTLTQQGDPAAGFALNMTFTGQTFTADAGSPFLEFPASAYVTGGGTADPGAWYYYGGFSGTLTGLGSYSGASIDLSQIGPNFQVGQGASGRNADDGASAWVGVNVTSEPTVGPALTPDGNGDLNLNVTSPCFGAEVCDGVDNDGDGEVDESGSAVDEAIADPAVYNLILGSPDRALWLSGIGDFDFEPSGVFEQDEAAGTATLVGTLTKQGLAGAGFTMSMTLSGFTDTAGPGSPFLELVPGAYVAGGGATDPSTWSYYTSFSATLSGTGSYAGATVNLAPLGADLQVGDGANGRNTEYGASSWVSVSVASQPTSGPALNANGDGSFNVDLTGPCIPAEVCDGIDNNGDGVIDEGFDADADGVTTCGGDCDDADANTYPGAAELCDGLDNDCDGVVPVFELDVDGDGLAKCDGDCDDGNPLVYPGSAELCDGLDNDCDGVVPADETDGDGDGLAVCAGDCDDTNPATNPGAAEVCDGVDNDCDGNVLDGEEDEDGDGYLGCEGDCDDLDPATYPGAPEVCDGLDNDCDGNVPTDETDWDGDGQAACDGDCNDGDAAIYDGAPELCDNIDTDCDGVADNGFDVDGDGIPDCVDSCPMVIDNDEDPWGESIAVGGDISEAYAAWGVHVERYAGQNFSTVLPAPTWDTSNPPVGEEDWGTPNIDFGGPGIGADGGIGAVGLNEFALGNVQPGLAGNNWWVVTFTSSTCVHDIKFLDVDVDEMPPQVILFDVNLQPMSTTVTTGLGDNSVETLDLGGTCGVYAMMIDTYANAAWDELTFCVDPSGGTEVCGDLIDNDGDGEVDEDCLDNAGGVDAAIPQGPDGASANGADPLSVNGANGAACSQSGDGSGGPGLLLFLGLGLVVRRRRTQQGAHGGSTRLKVTTL